MISNGIVQVDGSKYWYKDGLLHNISGPAVVCPNGYESWYYNGKQHRIDGPAITWMNGETEYWLEDVKYSYGEYKFRIFTMYHQKTI